MMLPTLLESAVRSMVLGTMVWGLLKCVRLHDTHAEASIWTAVLIAALSMPFVSQHLPSLVLTIPRWAQSVSHAIPNQDMSIVGVSTAAPVATHSVVWFIHHAWTLLTTVYVLGLLLCLSRLAAGLLLTRRLYRRSVPVQAAWVQGRNIRSSAAIRSPVSLAGTILLPLDWAGWSDEKREAVLAHEEAHIARADFYIQLAARIHRAFFWFSPFAWWLQSKLAEIAETASDEAAVLRVNDRIAYAELLVEVSRRAQRTPLLIGMAQSGLIQQRVEHILSETSKRPLNLSARVLSLVVLSALALAVASGKAVFGSGTVEAAPRSTAAAQRNEGGRAKPSSAAMPTPHRIVRAGRTIHGNRAVPDARQDRDSDPYNPRALLTAAHTPKPDYVPVSTFIHGGREYYLGSTHTPVADVTVTYAQDRRARP